MNYRTTILRAAPFLFFLALFAAPTRAQHANDHRLYGRVTTSDGDRFEGLMRWDKNEAGWMDVLDGSKRMQRERRRRNDRQRQVEVFGLKIRYEGDDESPTRKSGIRFGHIRRLETIGSNAALLTLWSGEEVEFRDGSTDIGTDNRGILVEDVERGEVELRWRDVAQVEFMQAGDVGNVPPSYYGERLYGTLRTRQGNAFTGFICWDIDEVLTEDALDGTDENGRRRKIRFANIEAIERNNSSSANILLSSGETVVLQGSNDVDNDNRGILVQDPDLGQVRVDWDNFDRVTFEATPAGLNYRVFEKSVPLNGTVYLRDGDKFSGAVRWDDDEAMTWEFLNGRIGDVDVEVEFGFIREIERISSREARITLRDGRAFNLRDSNDVNDDNDGIVVVQHDGDEIYVDWLAFDRLYLDR
jgi:hypothetical protein